MYEETTLNMMRRVNMRMGSTRFGNGDVVNDNDDDF